MNWQEILKIKRKGKHAVRGRAKRAIVTFLSTINIEDEFKVRDIIETVEDVEGVTSGILGQQLKHLVDDRKLERTIDKPTGTATYKYVRVHPPSEKRR